MIYIVLRFYSRFIIRLFIKRIDITGIELLPPEGSVFLASTHPNSFIDGMIINSMIDRPAWILARGDAFKEGFVKWFLMQIKLFPIYRLSEGRENLGKNDETFAQVLTFLRKEEAVLIFAEGLCTNQSELLPLKKGLPRMLLSGWLNELPVPVLPVGLTYNQFNGFGKLAGSGKYVNLNFGEVIVPADFERVANDNYFMRSFNDLLSERLEKILSWKFDTSKPASKWYYYAGWAINWPWYFLVQFVAKQLTKGTVHRDSVTLVLLIFTLPIYWGILLAILT